MIYLVHHADAVGPEVDPQRPLSEAGRSRADYLAVCASAHGVRPVVFWHSGKLRARQTADILRLACNPLAAMAAIRGLQPTDPPGWIRDRLIGEVRDVVMVGHFPSLPRILHLLVTNRDDGAADDFPAHGLVALEQKEDDEGWSECWRVT